MEHVGRQLAQNGCWIGFSSIYSGVHRRFTYEEPAYQEIIGGSVPNHEHVEACRRHLS